MLADVDTSGLRNVIVKRSPLDDIAPIVFPPAVMSEI